MGTFNHYFPFQILLLVAFLVSQVVFGVLLHDIIFGIAENTLAVFVGFVCMPVGFLVKRFGDMGRRSISNQNIRHA